MSLLETLTLGVGSGVAKGILKIWLKDQEIASSIGGSVIDLISSKTSDQLAQRKANRQFEELSEKVAYQLMELFEVEGTDSKEDNLIAAAKQAGDVLNRAAITAELLSENDLEPSRLEAHFHNVSRNASRDLNKTEKAFYDRMLSEASQYIVDIASQLPSFTERTLSEVLKRENVIISKTDRILQEIDRLRKDQGLDQKDHDSARFETEYRRAVVRRLDYLELFGTDLSSASKRYRLTVAYVALAVEQKTNEEKPFDTARTDDTEGELLEDDFCEIISVDQAISNSKRLFVKGPAGSGKSTLLQWVGVQAASKAFEGDLSSWNEKVPFYIRLRECADKGLPAPEQFPTMVASAIAGTMPNQWVHQQMSNAIVLIDGLDEVTQEKRNEVRNWLRELVESFPETNYILTSRPTAVAEGWMEEEGFVEAELQEMGHSDIEAFVKLWHEAIRQELQYDDLKDDITELENNIKKVLLHNRSIKKLAETPLLCAMLCALHRDREQELPSDRIELYRACCETLIQRRDVERRVQTYDYPDIGYRQKKALLEDFAYWLIKNGWSEVNEVDADKRLSLKSKNIGGIPASTNGKKLRQLFVDRTGLLRQPSPGEIDFAHRTFQEFMAAQAALSEGDIGLLTQNAHDDQWREVIVLAAGLARKDESELIIRSLLDRGDHSEQHRHRLHLLAVGCLETSIELSHPTKLLVEERLTELVPPKNMTEASALSSAGDLVIPHLKYKPQMAGKLVAASARALNLIGTEAAHISLQDYFVDRRKIVIKEILRSWHLVNNVQAARRIIPQLEIKDLPRAVRKSTNETVANEILKSPNFQYLSVLNLAECVNLTDISPLSDLHSIKALNLRGCTNLRDISPLKRLTRVERLNFVECKSITDIHPLGELTSLIELDLRRCSNLTKLCSMKNFSSLESLNLTECKSLSKFDLIGELENVKRLHLSSCNKLENISFARKLRNLEVLDLSDSKKLTDLSPVKNLKKLSFLDLSYCTRINDISALKNLDNLSILLLHKCNPEVDLTPLLEIKSLSYLTFGQNIHLTSHDDIQQYLYVTNLSAMP